MVHTHTRTECCRSLVFRGVNGIDPNTIAEESTQAALGKLQMLNSSIHVLHIIVDGGTKRGHAAASDGHLRGAGAVWHGRPGLGRHDGAGDATADDRVPDVVSGAYLLDGALCGGEGDAEEGKALGVAGHGAGGLAHADAQQIGRAHV